MTTNTLWSVVLLFASSCVSCGSKPVAPPTNDGVVMLPISIQHLSTRVGTTIPVSIRFTQNNGSNSLDTMAADMMQRVGVRRGGTDESVPTAVEAKADHWGVGFDVTWDPQMGAGWYILKMPPPASTPILNANEFNVASNGDFQYYFRVGSEPLLQRIVRCKRDNEYGFAVDFSEEMRAESDQIERLIELNTETGTLTCRSSAELFSATAQDFSRPFRTLYATCEIPSQDSSSYNVVFSDLKSPEGRKLARAGQGEPVVDVQWSEDAPVANSGCNVWYESRLPF